MAESGTARSAACWIEDLGLQKHPEGGYFREMYRSGETIARDALPDRFPGARAFSTAILFLLEGREFSALHRIRSDECWHFYAGASLTLHIIGTDGTYAPVGLGRDIENGEAFQVVVGAGYWFGATVNDPESYALVGCTVAPGFDFEDFEMGGRKDLVKRYPEHRSIIERLTR